MTQLAKSEYLSEIRDNSERLATVASRAMDTLVPTCPGWYVASVVAHLGEVQRQWALQLRERAQEPVPLPESTFEELPGLPAWFDGMDAGASDPATIPDGLVEWLRSGTDELLRAFDPLTSDETIWHWSGDNRAIVHMRNQALEAAVHRWDVENAVGATTSISESLLTDGIDQHFEVQIPAGRANHGNPEGSGESFHFHRTDGPGEWLVEFSGCRVAWSHDHAKADVAVRGRGEDIFLWLWGRGHESELEVLGEANLLDRYRELACTQWV